MLVFPCLGAGLSPCLAALPGLALVLALVGFPGLGTEACIWPFVADCCLLSLPWALEGRLYCCWVSLVWSFEWPCIWPLPFFCMAPASGPFLSSERNRLEGDHGTTGGVHVLLNSFGSSLPEAIYSFAHNSLLQSVSRIHCWSSLTHALPTAQYMESHPDPRPSIVSRANNRLLC